MSTEACLAAQLYQARSAEEREEIYEAIGEDYGWGFAGAVREQFEDVPLVQASPAWRSWMRPFLWAVAALCLVLFGSMRVEVSYSCNDGWIQHVGQERVTL